MKKEIKEYKLVDDKDLEHYDLMRNPEIKNALMEITEEWKSIRDTLCPDSGLKCNDCITYNGCEKQIYDIFQKRKKLRKKVLKG